MQTFDVIVHAKGGSYVTGVYQGHCAACRTSAQSAAEQLGLQLFGESFLRAEPLPGPAAAPYQGWRLFASTEG
ncbi:hypothetical protein [Caldimonas sp. KR1-144]|uniref:hypothetical protein n=1 Tax=Caldimonas sp. KR1-144 TaxID=3400911 RepID=UPI003C1197AF